MSEEADEVETVESRKRYAPYRIKALDDMIASLADRMAEMEDERAALRRLLS